MAVAGCSVDDLLNPDEEPALVVSPTSLRFGESLTEKTFSVTNGGGGALDWSVTVASVALHRDRL